MRLILASSNKHKLEELQELFAGSSIELELPEYEIDVDETGDTYIDNALLKAKTYYDEFKQPTIADDSGLNVEALHGLLGVKSARFAPELDGQEQKNLKLLELLMGQSSRDAFFTSQLCCYLNPKEVFFFEGILKGHISQNPSGDGGFGYDPIFIGEGRVSTLAEDKEWKNLNSHRARAVKAAINFFTGYA